MRIFRALLTCGLVAFCYVARGQGMPAPAYVGPGYPYPISAAPSPENANPALYVPPVYGQPMAQIGAANMPPPGAALLPEQIPPQQPLGQPMLPPLLEAKPPAPPPKIWDGSFELGLAGTDGDSQTLNFHFGAKLKYKTEENVITSELAYHLNTSNSTNTANTGLQEARAEHIFCDTPWTCFVHDRLDYDQFSSYDTRISLDTGVGYQFIKNDATSLITRFGCGTSKASEGPDTDFLPELVFGMEGEHKLSKQQKLTGSVEYRPDRQRLWQRLPRRNQGGLGNSTRRADALEPEAGPARPLRQRLWRQTAE